MNHEIILIEIKIAVKSQESTLFYLYFEVNCENYRFGYMGHSKFIFF